MANQARGEARITAGGRSHGLRLTFGGLCEIEDALGCGMAEVIARFAERRFSLRDVQAVLREGLKGAGAPMPEAELEKLIVGAGLIGAAASVCAALRAVLGPPAGDET